MQPVYTEEYVRSVAPRHKQPSNLRERVAYAAVKVARTCFDIVSGYKKEGMKEAGWMRRILFLETVAGVLRSCCWWLSSRLLPYPVLWLRVGDIGASLSKPLPPGHVDTRRRAGDGWGNVAPHAQSAQHAAGQWLGMTLSDMKRRL